MGLASSRTCGSEASMLVTLFACDLEHVTEPRGMALRRGHKAVHTDRRVAGTCDARSLGMLEVVRRLRGSMSGEKKGTVSLCLPSLYTRQGYGDILTPSSIKAPANLFRTPTQPELYTMIILLQLKCTQRRCLVS